jgi:hypothetical protein
MRKLMSNQSLFYNATLPIANKSYEQVYHVPIPNVDAFELINTAIWYTLARLAPGDNTIVNGVEGGTCYYIGSGPIHIQLFVLRLTTKAAKVRVFPLYPTDPIEGILWLNANHEQMAKTMAAVYTACVMEIRNFLRDAAAAENFNPPPPKTNDWSQILEWQETYYPHLSDKQIDEQFHISAKSLANNRSLLGKRKKQRAK